MPPPDRDKLRAGLSSLLAGDPTAIDPAPSVPMTEPHEAPPSPSTPRQGDAPADRKTARRGASAAKPASTPTAGAGSARTGTEQDSESAHVRTSTGYVREGGERVYRVSVMLTRDERRRLREQADDEGVSITDLVRRTLNL